MHTDNGYILVYVKNIKYVNMIIFKAGFWTVKLWYLISCSYPSIVNLVLIFSIEECCVNKDIHTHNVVSIKHTLHLSLGSPMGTGSKWRLTSESASIMLYQCLGRMCQIFCFHKYRSAICSQIWNYKVHNIYYDWNMKFSISMSCIVPKMHTFAFLVCFLFIWSCWALSPHVEWHHMLVCSCGMNIMTLLKEPSLEPFVYFFTCFTHKCTKTRF